MRFGSRQDYQTILKLNRELINTVVDTPAIIYKLHVTNTKVNIYGEGVNKSYYSGVLVPCLYSRTPPEMTNDVGTVDVEQDAMFSFLRQELIDRNMYPEIGDIIEFDVQYYEINTIREIQNFLGQESYNHSVVCDVHLMRRVPTQLEKNIS